MYGFIATTDITYSPNLLQGQVSFIKTNKFSIFYNALPKFQNDHLFYEDSDKIVLLDGVILNKKELCKKFDSKEWNLTFENIYKLNENTFMNELRGSFRGIVYKKTDNSCIAFTNQTGEKTLFYTSLGGKLFISTHNDLTAEYLKSKKINYKLNIQAMYELLTCGYMLNTNTPIESNYRITAGCYLKTKNKEEKIFRYHLLKSKPEINLPLEKAIDEFDNLYRKAIYRIFSKNNEYGYNHIADLSGGLDSRMVNFVARDLGFKNVLNICYGQKGNADNKIAEKIAKDLQNEYLFEALDKGEFLYDIDEVVGKYGGQSVFFICTGAYRAFKKIKSKNIGISATGTFASNINALLTEEKFHTPPGMVNIFYSNFLKLTCPPSYFKDFSTFEEFNTYGFNTHLINDSIVARQEFTEAFSPMTDVEVAEYCARLPIQYRLDRLFLKKWIIDKYPKAASYIWQHTMKPLNKDDKVYFPALIYRLNSLMTISVNKILTVFKINYAFSQKGEMNPIEVWYKTNPELRAFIDDYYNCNIKRIENIGLKEDVKKMFKTEYAMDKLLIINVLAVLKRYF